MKILFCASEATPFAASGGLGDVAGSLPQALCEKKVDCRVVLPLYGDLRQQYREKLVYIGNFHVPVGWRNQYCGVFEYRSGDVVYYFLDNEYYFKRSGLYGFYDDGERFAFFSRAVLEMLSQLDFVPDLIHCHDWQTALVPVYLNLYYRHMEQFRAIKTVFTIHNIQYQGKYGMEILEDTVGIGYKDAHIAEYDGCCNYMKAAIECADRISTVSPTYAQEILDPWYSHGLDELLKQKHYKLCGILNGIDIKTYNPETDDHIAANYHARAAQKGKAKCREELQRLFGLKDEARPIVAMVTRLVGHKGLDLVRHVAHEMVDGGVQLVVLGSGEPEYEAFFTELANRCPDHVGVKIGFIPSLARKLYAGADIFLMPSKSEPCGLSQMVALRYGTVPVVRETGGLRDSVHDIGEENGNGFTFASYNAHDMLYTVMRAKECFADRKEWNRLVKCAMECDFSWTASAQEYINMYQQTCALW